MKLCKIVGKAWCTVKDEQLTGLKFLLAREINSSGLLNEKLLVAVDELGAGEGDTVIISRGSALSNTSFNNKPVDAAIVAIVEKCSIKEN